MHQGTVLGERAEIEEDMVEFEGMVETEGFRKLTKEAETQGGWRETGGTGGGVDHKKEVVPGNEDLDFRKQISPELDEEETEKLVKDLGRFVDVFAKGNEPLGMCNMAEHEIPLVPNAKPVYQSLTSTAYKEQLIHRELMSKIKARGAFEVSFGPWGARVLLAQKKDGTWRFCVDYRLLNALTVNSVYPMPSIDGALARLHGAKILSIMDLECGYWQIPIKKGENCFYYRGRGFPVRMHAVRPVHSSKHVPTDNGSGAGGGLRWSVCLVYLDDMFARNTEEHRQRLVMVLSALRKANLKLKLAKCRFGEKNNHVGSPN